MKDSRIGQSSKQKTLPMPDRSLDNFEVEWQKQQNKGTPLENPLVCDKCKNTGNVYHVKSPIFFQYFLYLLCPKCEFYWKVYYEHTLPVQYWADRTLDEKSGSECIEFDCHEPKMGNFNVCRDHWEKWS